MKERNRLVANFKFIHPVPIEGPTDATPSGFSVNAISWPSDGINLYFIRPGKPTNNAYKVRYPDL
jgi:hypothetical protein